MEMRSGFFAGLLLATVSAAAAFAQGGPIKLANVAELSGGGATVGNNWKNGIDLAIEEINAKGGLLGRKLEVTHADSQSNPGVARAQVQKALDGEPYVLLGPGYSGSVKVTAPLASEAGIAQIMGGEAAELTQAGNKFLFRTSFGQQSSMPKVAKYINDEVKAKSVAIVWVNNDFGRGGRDVITKEFGKYVSKIKGAAPDAVFIYVNEEESARILKELKRQAIAVPLIGETTLIGQKVVELAGDAANGARGHVGLTTDAPVDLIKAFREKFSKKYNYVPDHNGLKGWLAIYMIKATTEKMGKVDPKAFSDNLHGLTIKASSEPGILMDATFDQNGDIDRQGFLVEIVEGKQVIKQVLPKLGS